MYSTLALTWQTVVKQAECHLYYKKKKCKK